MGSPEALWERLAGRCSAVDGLSTEFEVEKGDGEIDNHHCTAEATKERHQERLSDDC